MTNKYKTNTLAGWAIFIVATVLTVYFLPRDNSNRYSYAVNRPWGYSLLTAPFDIPVYLDSVRAREVRDSLDAAFEPVIKRDVALENRIINQFSEIVTNSPNIDLRQNEKSALIEELKTEFEAGIVDPSLYEYIQSGQLPRVRQIHDNVANSISTSGFMSARKAYAHIDSTFHDDRYLVAISESRLAQLLSPNISIDSAETKRLYAEMLQRAMAPIGVIQQGERIIDKGDIVTLKLYTILNTYEQLDAKRGGGTSRDNYYPLAGQLLYILLLFGSLYGYLHFFRPEYYRNIRIILMIMLVIVAFIIFSFLLVRTFRSALYIVPFTIVPIVLVVFLDSRTAFFAHIVTVLGAMLASVFPMEFIFVQYMAGVVAIDSIKELSKRSQLIRTAFLVFCVYSLSYFAVELLHNWSIDRISWKVFGYFGINAVLISFAYIIIFILEKLFGFTSKVTLVELSDINHPVLRKLSEECPGTFQHSMAVSNLAAAAADKIGANMQLVRSGALYHDIGKIDNPAFFTENQHGVNPHDALDSMQSAKIVIGHIHDGLKRADKEKLPPVIKDFIAQHHGKGKARYFYNTWCNNHPGETPDDNAFTYPGPNPKTKEASILMMADAVEAASRSLNQHTPEAISGLVNKIIDSQIEEGLHNDSPLSFKDVQDIKNIFINRLRTMYHSRISYPEIVKPAES